MEAHRLLEKESIVIYPDQQAAGKMVSYWVCFELQKLQRSPTVKYFLICLNNATPYEPMGATFIQTTIPNMEL